MGIDPVLCVYANTLPNDQLEHIEIQLMLMHRYIFKQFKSNF